MRVHMRPYAGAADIQCLVHPQAQGSGVETEILAWSTGLMRAGPWEAALPCGVAATRAKRNGVRSWNEPASTSCRQRICASCVRQTHHCRQLLCPLGSPCGGHEEEELEQYQELHRAVFDGIGMGLDYHQSPAYQLDLDLIAVDVAGTFAAFCLCELHQVADSRGAHTVGEIGVIGTHPTHHKLGLGRALPLTWMRLFTVMGFRVVSAWQWMTREIAPPA